VARFGCYQLGLEIWPEMAAATASATAPVTLAGLGLYLAGLAFVIAGMSAASLSLFLAGTVVGGLAVGALFIGSLSTANADFRAR
jgi:hypothetical protein